MSHNAVQRVLPITVADVRVDTRMTGRRVGDAPLGTPPIRLEAQSIALDGMTPTEARTLAELLRAAADEAERVARGE